MARKEFFYVKANEVVTNMLKAFIEQSQKYDNQAEFFEKNVFLFMLAVDRDLFTKLFEESIQKLQKEEYAKLKTLIKLTEVMNFYNTEKNMFITRDGYVTVETLLEKGYHIRDKQLIVNL
ncbi:hypothetical protein [Thermotalea metallivorans]|uniref:Uncharacterized protein n=1 Tax=Thermotalea metallivorans TaxID=520762 RepID=A0A140KZA7_9FIRM|nr:hypothetical protein [Thermotalea metallivorans]KXG73632.1 hypothetical protein AN619_30310 [Thermotalea metallivorans]